MLNTIHHDFFKSLVTESPKLNANTKLATKLIQIPPRALLYNNIKASLAFRLCNSELIFISNDPNLITTRSTKAIVLISDDYNK